MQNEVNKVDVPVRQCIYIPISTVLLTKLAEKANVILDGKAEGQTNEVILEVVENYWFGLVGKSATLGFILQELAYEILEEGNK
jgi:hypothetical protein